MTTNTLPQSQWTEYSDGYAMDYYAYAGSPHQHCYPFPSESCYENGVYIYLFKMSNHLTVTHNLESATNAITPCKNQIEYDDHNSCKVQDTMEASHSSLSDLLKETQEVKAEVPATHANSKVIDSNGPATWNDSGNPDKNGREVNQCKIKLNSKHHEVTTYNKNTHAKNPCNEIELYVDNNSS